jgi:predicted ATP-grasp superfamily ATP-dependent carboligase
MTALARSIGIAVPETWTLGEDEGEAARLASRLPYPVVLKPAMSHEPAGRRVRSTGAPLYARDAAQFLAQYRDLRVRSRAIIVQPFLEGTGAGYFALVQHGRVLADFAHRRIRDVRPTGSGSAVRESVAVDAALAGPARALLAALGWHGVAMVEYRVTDAGTPVFLELNPRFWTSLPLAIAAGVDFPRLLVELAETGGIAAPPPYRVGVRCRWWVGDVQHLAQVWRGAPAGYPGRFPSRLTTLAAFLTPRRGTVHDNFRWSDPGPEAGDWLHFVARRIPAWLNRADRSLELTDAQGRAAHP